jgi:hypothetical protein
MEALLTEGELFQTAESIISSLFLYSTFVVPYIFTFYIYKKFIVWENSLRKKIIIYFIILVEMYFIYIKAGIYVAGILAGAYQLSAYGFSIPLFFLSFIFWLCVGIKKIAKNNFLSPFSRISKN